MTRSHTAGVGEATLATNLYDRIRADVLTGELAPGDKLRIDALAVRYGAGQTPLREALNRLTSEGLVERREQRGFAVATASGIDLVEITKTRCWLEEIAVRESIAARSPAWEEELVLAEHRLSRTPRSLHEDRFEDNPEWERLHRAFHRTLVSNCGSAWLMTFCERLADQLYRYRRLSVRQVLPERYERVEHKAIVDAALAGDADAAVGLLVAHFGQTAQMIMADRAALAPPPAPL